MRHHALARGGRIAALVGFLALFAPLAGCNGSAPGATRVRVVSETRNAFTGFSTTDGDSIADLRFADTGRLLAAELSGTVYVLDVAPGGAISLVRSFTVSATALPIFGDAVSQLHVISRRAAYLTGTGEEVVYTFDPETATAASCGKLAIGGRVRVHGGGRPASTGAPTGDFDPAFVHTALRIGDKMFVTFSNFDLATFGYLPGTVLVYDLDPADPLAVLSAASPQDVTATAAFQAGVDRMPRRAIFTSAFNPQNAAAYVTEGGKTLLLVIDSGVYDFGAGAVTHDGAIDVIDPATETIVATYPLPGAAPIGLAIAPGRRMLATGSSAFAVASLVDLRGLDVLRGNLAARVVATALPLPRLNAGVSNFVVDLDASADGRFAYAVNFNDSSITAIDLAATPRVAGIFAVTGRSGVPARRESLTSFVRVRPGAPGAAYTGPDLFTAAVLLADADETPPGTGNDNAIDTFETSPR